MSEPLALLDAGNDDPPQGCRWRPRFDMRRGLPSRSLSAVLAT